MNDVASAAATTGESAGLKTSYRTCPICEASCGLEIKVAGGRIVSIRGNEADVFSRGYLCPKGVALKDLHEDPDRLRRPLVKRGGRFVETSWDEAFAEIERRLPPILERHGRSAAALVVGNPTVHNASLLLYVSRLGKALGTPNLFSASTLDQMPKQLSCGLMFGHWISIPVPDIERCELLVVLGANPVASNGSLWTVPDFRGKAKALQARGGKLIVIDPRRTETAALADEHRFIRPGADVFLLLGMVQTLFAEGRVRLGRLESHVCGLNDLAESVAPFSPERVAARCGIEPDAIRGLARALAGTPRAAVYGRIGTCTQEYGTATSWLIDVLNVLTGHLDEPGGAMFPKAAAFAANTGGKPGTGKGVTTGRRKSRVSGAPEVFGEFPIGCLAEEIETPGEGQVKAAITVAANPVLSVPNGPRLAAALDSLELMVSLDIYVNETTRHADVILPGLSPLEELHFDVAFPQLSYRNYARFSAPVLERPADQPPEWQTMLRLAAIAQDGRASAANLAEDQAPEALIDAALRAGPYGLTLAQLRAAPQGIDLGPLAPRVPEVLRTPSGRIELAPRMLLAELARASADLERPAPPLVIVGRRDVRSNNSWMHNLPVLAKGPFRCTALVHPADAARLGLAHGARARIEAGGRAIEAEVEVSDEMMPGVVSLPHGWGHELPGARLSLAARRPGANLNAVLDEARRDPLSGNAVLSGVAVQMTPVR
jgi:anaerobic selenocysteine-containing dehydrogenase